MYTWYDDVLLISQIGTDYGLDAATVRLMSYIHRRCMNGSGVEYFSIPTTTDAEELKRDLGIDGELLRARIIKINSKSCPEKRRDDIVSDILIEAYGGSDPDSDLFKDSLSKLKMYIDEGFRNEKFGLYIQVAKTLPKFRKGAEPHAAY